MFVCVRACWLGRYESSWSPPPLLDGAISHLRPRATCQIIYQLAWWINWINDLFASANATGDMLHFECKCKCKCADSNGADLRASVLACVLACALACVSVLQPANIRSKMVCSGANEQFDWFGQITNASERQNNKQDEPTQRTMANLPTIRGDIQMRANIIFAPSTTIIIAQWAKMSAQAHLNSATRAKMDELWESSGKSPVASRFSPGQQTCYGKSSEHLHVRDATATTSTTERRPIATTAHISRHRVQLTELRPLCPT